MLVIILLCIRLSYCAVICSLSGNCTVIVEEQLGNTSVSVGSSKFALRTFYLEILEHDDVLVLEHVQDYPDVWYGQKAVSFGFKKYKVLDETTFSWRLLLLPNKTVYAEGTYPLDRTVSPKKVVNTYVNMSFYAVKGETYTCPEPFIQDYARHTIDNWGQRESCYTNRGIGAPSIVSPHITINNRTSKKMCLTHLSNRLPYTVDGILTFNLTTCGQFFCYKEGCIDIFDENRTLICPNGVFVMTYVFTGVNTFTQRYMNINMNHSVLQIPYGLSNLWEQNQRRIIIGWQNASMVITPCTFLFYNSTYMYYRTIRCPINTVIDLLAMNNYINFKTYVIYIITGVLQAFRPINTGGYHTYTAGNMMHSNDVEPIDSLVFTCPGGPNICEIVFIEQIPRLTVDFKVWELTDNRPYGAFREAIAQEHLSTIGYSRYFVPTLAECVYHHNYTINFVNAMPYLKKHYSSNPQTPYNAHGTTALAWMQKRENYGKRANYQKRDVSVSLYSISLNIPSYTNSSYGPLCINSFLHQKVQDMDTGILTVIISIINICSPPSYNFLFDACFANPVVQKTNVNTSYSLATLSGIASCNTQIILRYTDAPDYMTVIPITNIHTKSIFVKTLADFDSWSILHKILFFSLLIVIAAIFYFLAPISLIVLNGVKFVLGSLLKPLGIVSSSIKLISKLIVTFTVLFSSLFLLMFVFLGHSALFSAEQAAIYTALVVGAYCLFSFFAYIVRKFKDRIYGVTKMAIVISMLICVESCTTIPITAQNVTTCNGTCGLSTLVDLQVVIAPNSINCFGYERLNDKMTQIVIIEIDSYTVNYPLQFQYWSGDLSVIKTFSQCYCNVLSCPAVEYPDSQWLTSQNNFGLTGCPNSPSISCVYWQRNIIPRYAIHRVLDEFAFTGLNGRLRVNEKIYPFFWTAGLNQISLSDGIVITAVLPNYESKILKGFLIDDTAFATFYLLSDELVNLRGLLDPNKAGFVQINDQYNYWNTNQTLTNYQYWSTETTIDVSACAPHYFVERPAPFVQLNKLLNVESLMSRLFFEDSVYAMQLQNDPTVNGYYALGLTTNNVLDIKIQIPTSIVFSYTTEPLPRILNMSRVMLAYDQDDVLIEVLLTTSNTFGLVECGIATELNETVESKNVYLTNFTLVRIRFYASGFETFRFFARTLILNVSTLFSVSNLHIIPSNYYSNLNINITDIGTEIPYIKHDDDADCGFFCRIKRFFTNLLDSANIFKNVLGYVLLAISAIGGVITTIAFAIVMRYAFGIIIDLLHLLGKAKQV